MMKFHTNTFAIVVAAAMCGFATGQSDGAPTILPAQEEQDQWAPLTTALSQVVETGFGVGMSVAILDQDGSLRYTRGFGDADQDTSRPYTTTTVNHWDRYPKHSLVWRWPRRKSWASCRGMTPSMIIWIGISPIRAFRIRPLRSVTWQRTRAP